MYTPDELIEKAQRSLASDDDEQLAEALEMLIDVEPDRWLQLLTLNGLWPEPSTKPSSQDAKQLAQKLSCLMGAIQRLLISSENNVNSVLAVFRILQGSTILQYYYS